MPNNAEPVTGPGAAKPGRLVRRRVLAPRGGRGYLRDIIYGAIDGSVTTFALVAGVAGAGLSPTIILALGFANVFADGFSMAAGNFSGTKAELDDITRVRKMQAARIAEDLDSELVALRQILSRKGLSGQTLEAVVGQISKNETLWIETVLEGEYGLATVDPLPMRAALATFFAFLVAGLIPLIPFLLGVPNEFTVSAGLTLLTFFVIGAYKSVWSLSPWWRSGLETFLIGGVAASLAYFVGSLFNMGG